MKSRFFTILSASILLASLFGYVTIAHAQTTCTDATGATIPCPPSGGGSSDDNDNDSGSNPTGGNPNPPSVVTATPSATPTPLPTNTPLPVKDKPTENPTKNAPSEVTPTPTSEPVIASNGPSADPNPEPGIPWGPIGLATVGIVILIGLLLPAVQKIREAAARTQSKSKKQSSDIHIESFRTKHNDDPSPQTREHVLLNKDDGDTEAAVDFLLTLDGVKGETKGRIKKPVLVVRKPGGEQQD